MAWAPLALTLEAKIATRRPLNGRNVAQDSQFRCDRHHSACLVRPCSG